MVVAELTAGERKAASVEVIEGCAADTPVCPHCSAERVVKNGSADGLQRYKCRSCRKTFNALTGTPLARLRMKGKWLEQTAALRDGLSLTQVTERMGISRHTAFRWRHRFLALPKTVKAQALVGIAETDETFFLRSNKGQRQGLGRTPRKRGGKATKRGLSKELVSVLVARDRSGSTADFILEADDKTHVAAALKPILPKDTILCTDGSGTLAAAAKEIGVTHRPVNLSAGIRVIAGVTFRTSMLTTPGSRIGYAASRACPHATSTAISAGSEPLTGRAAVRYNPRLCWHWRSGYESIIS